MKINSLGSLFKRPATYIICIYVIYTEANDNGLNLNIVEGILQKDACIEYWCMLIFVLYFGVSLIV